MLTGDTLEIEVTSVRGVKRRLPTFEAVRPTTYCRTCYALWPSNGQHDTEEPACRCCRNCGQPEWRHAKPDCLFQATTYSPWGTIYGAYAYDELSARNNGAAVGGDTTKSITTDFDAQSDFE